MVTSFKDFLKTKQKYSTPLSEAIQPHHEDMAHEYDHLGNLDDTTIRHMSSVFTHGPHHSVVDLGEHQGFADPDVTEHLRTHGWKIHDYQKGTAHRTVQVGAPERGIPLRDKVVHKNIGRILDETNAPQATKSAFENDSERKLKSTGGLKVLITTHPYATVGKTSGTSWSGESCMNADTGSYKHKLADDSANGTHEAFLIHSDDSGVHTGYPSNPISRISLKRYDSEPDLNNDDSHTVFRPETRAYGAGTNSFASTVQHWAEHNHPATEGRTYYKNNEVYDDSGNDSFKSLSDKNVNNMIDSMPMGSHSLSKRHLDLAMNNISSETNPERKSIKIENAASGIQNLNVEHVHELGNSVHQMSLSDDTPTKLAAKDGFLTLARQHGDKFSTGLIEKFRLTNTKFGGTDERLPRRVISNKKLPMHVVNNLPTNELVHVHDSLIKPHHIDKVLDSYVKRESGSAAPIQHFVGKFNKNHIDRFVNDIGANIPCSEKSLIENKHFNEGHTEAILAKPHLSHYDQVKVIESAPGIQSKHLQAKSINSSVEKKAAALRNPKISNEVAAGAADYLTSPEVLPHAERMKIGEGSNKHFTDEHVEKLVNHHLNSPHIYGFDNIHDHELSTRMLHNFGKKIDDETKVHEAAMKSGDDYDTEKLERMHVAHEEHMEKHYDNFFGEKSESEKADSPEFLKFAEHAQHHHENDTTGQGYSLKFRSTED